MKRVLHRGFQHFEVLEWHERRPEDVFREFRDWHAALHFLHPFLRDSLNMANIRKILYGTSWHGSSTRLNDYQVLEVFAWRLVYGQCKILELSIIKGSSN